MTVLYIDADACPVKVEAERVATRHKIHMYVVSNGGLRPSQNPLVETIIVPDGPDVADMWIAERAGVGDVVVTGDIPLAAKCVEAGAQVSGVSGVSDRCPIQYVRWCPKSVRKVSDISGHNVRGWYVSDCIGVRCVRKVSDKCPIGVR